MSAVPAAEVVIALASLSTYVHVHTPTHVYTLHAPTCGHTNHRVKNKNKFLKASYLNWWVQSSLWFISQGASLENISVLTAETKEFDGWRSDSDVCVCNTEKKINTELVYLLVLEIGQETLCTQDEGSLTLWLPQLCPTGLTWRLCTRRHLFGRLFLWRVSF